MVHVEIENSSHYELSTCLKQWSPTCREKGDATTCATVLVTSIHHEVGWLNPLHTCCVCTTSALDWFTLFSVGLQISATQIGVPQVEAMALHV
jgi:hypothetical protein